VTDVYRSFSRQVGYQQGIRSPVVFNNGPCRMFGIPEGVEFGLGNAECLNELHAAMWRVERPERWIVKKGKANNVRLKI